MNTFLTVRETAEMLQKSEETIKRWLRSGKFSNAYKTNDKQGWRIPIQDIQASLISEKSISTNDFTDKNSTEYTPPQDENIKELVSLAYQAVTLASPTESMLDILSHIGIKRTLEVLLIMQQSPNKVKNPDGFIKKAIGEGWTPTTLPIRKQRNIARVLDHREEEAFSSPLFNWLEQD